MLGFIAQRLALDELTYVPLMHNKFPSSLALKFADNLGPGIVKRIKNVVGVYYKLTVLGFLLSNSGEQYEKLLVAYLIFLKKRFSKLPEPEHYKIEAMEVSIALSLKEDEFKILPYLLLASGLCGDMS